MNSSNVNCNASESSQSVTLATNGYTKTGYRFDKWALGSASGTQYAQGNSYNPSLAYNASTFGKTFYAIWNRVMAENVSYDNNDTGVPCTDTQCMIDCLAYKFKYGGTCTVPTLQVGDYVSMTPSLASYTPATAGFSGTVAPNELNLWRVIKVNSVNVELVSEYVSTGNITASGTNGYKNYVAGLQEVANAYQNSNYTVSARMMGYDGQTLSISDTSAFDGTSTTPPSTTSTSTPTTGTGEEFSGGVLGDTLYLKDYESVSTVYSTDTATYGSNGLKGYKKDGTIAKYWLASRRYAYTSSSGSFYFYARYINSTTTNSSLTTYPFTSYNGSSSKWGYSTPSYPVRPIVTFKSGVTTASGSGTKADPYVLN